MDPSESIIIIMLNVIMDSTLYICTSIDAILRSTLSFYMENTSIPLPTPEEVLVCNPSTTAEEVAR